MTSSTDVKEMYVSLLKDIALNYTTVEEKRFLLNIDYNNPRDLDIIIPFYSRKIKQIAQYYSKKREDVVQSSFRNTLKGSDFGVEVSASNIQRAYLGAVAQGGIEVWLPARQGGHCHGDGGSEELQRRSGGEVPSSRH